VAVLLQREDKVARADADVAVEPAQQLLVDPTRGDDVGEGVGDLLLRVAVLGQGTSDREDLHRGDSFIDGERVGGKSGGEAGH